MSISRIPAVLTAVAVTVALTATPAAARVTPEPENTRPVLPTQQQAAANDSACRIVSGDPRAEAARALPRVPGSIDLCPAARSLAERRLLHADLIQAIRDGE